MPFAFKHYTSQPFRASQARSIYTMAPINPPSTPLGSPARKSPLSSPCEQADASIMDRDTEETPHAALPNPAMRELGARLPSFQEGFGEAIMLADNPVHLQTLREPPTPTVASQTVLPLPVPTLAGAKWPPHRELSGVRDLARSCAHGFGAEHREFGGGDGAHLTHLTQDGQPQSQNVAGQTHREPTGESSCTEQHNESTASESSHTSEDEKPAASSPMKRSGDRQGGSTKRRRLG